MYIIIETVSFNHPLKSLSYIQFLDQYSYSHFEIAHIDDEHFNDVNLTGFVYEIVDEKVARSAKFAKADHNNRIGILEGSVIHDELIFATLEHHSSKPKVYYTLTKEDIANQVEFLKQIMHLELEMYYRDLNEHVRSENQQFKEIIKTAINSCTTVFHCRELLHKRFGTATNHIIAEKNNWGGTKVKLTQ